MTTLDTRQFVLHLPADGIAANLDQDEEWCEVEVDGERRRIRFHDYAAIYEIPGLYEQLFYEVLECRSPEVVCELLGSELDRAGAEPEDLAVLDFGAGNGMVGEQLAGLGFGTIVGIDLLPEARAAALRDRPGVYDDYRALDLNALSPADRSDLESHGFDCLTCVAALGFGDVPPSVFAQAFNLLAPGGWLAFNLRERFLRDDDPAGFGALIARMLDKGVIEQRARTRYTHRVSVSGQPLDYVALVATKQRELPMHWTR
jgi:2-polyprenyl-3-methyl-5-hydroxy-6-metoxy-1,4-benzoquinol methylase